MPHSDSPLRVLAIASRFKLTQIEYLKAIGRHVDLTIAVNGEEGAQDATRLALEEGMRATQIGRIGVKKVSDRLQRLIETVKPDVVHTLYHYNDEMTVLARRLAGGRAAVIHETRDPLTTMIRMTKFAPGADPRAMERAALTASDGQIVVSNAMREYFEGVHQLDLSDTTLVVPMCFCGDASIAPPQPKLSADDGRVHIALDGSVTSDRRHGRYCADIIRRLTAVGLVVHSHFHDTEGRGNPLYRDLSSELDDYHYHEVIPFRDGTRYSEALSRYDLMGVFHELEAERYNEADLLAINMPTKALSGWLCGGIPTVCFPHYKGVLEPVHEFGLGFVVERLEDVANIAADRAAIERATEACLEHRHRFTTEFTAQRIARFYERIAAARGE